jgi:peptide-methionine (S)-S-oxide reductase
MIKQIGFGGGCHWCTEAVFQALQGVVCVEQGWISSQAPHENFSEGVIVYYDTNKIDLQVLIEIHLLTHSSTKKHSMRNKYRSAIYYFNDNDKVTITNLLKEFEQKNEVRYITQNLSFVAFKKNKESQLNYYQKNKKAPFCITYIDPKLQAIREKFSKQIL